MAVLTATSSGALANWSIVKVSVLLSQQPDTKKGT
jgi:hypothetical protein